VLLIDGEPDAGRLAASYLEKFFDVHWAPTGRAGQALLGGAASDVVVLEYRLPDCSGLDLVRQIRCEHRELPIIMATRHGSEQVCASAFRLGVCDYLSKPIEETELVAAVRRLVQGRRPAPLPGLLNAPVLPAAERSDAGMESVARHVHERYADRLSINEIARLAGMNRSVLSRRFTAHFRMPLRTYIAQVRVTHAMLLLGRLGPSVTQIAHDVGFYDLPRFDKVFRRVSGMSPSAYRRVTAESQKGKVSDT
jgi:YesN/AraC family two-component response regulator